MNKFTIYMNEVLKQNSITDFSFGCNKEFISEIVVIAPNWKVNIFKEHSDSIEDLKDCFGVKYYPDEQLSKRIYSYAEEISNGKAGIHFGKTYSSDTILAEYMNLNRIREFECDCIEMETSAFYKAASYMKLKAAAILMILDNTIDKKPLFAKLCENDIILKKNSKFNLIPNIIIKTIEEISKGM